MSKQPRPSQTRPATRRRIVIIEELEESPTDLFHLSLSCPHHAASLPMHPLGETVSACGEVLVLYGCGDPACRYREGWGMDPHSGRPRRLIRGFDQSRR